MPRDWDAVDWHWRDLLITGSMAAMQMQADMVAASVSRALMGEGPEGASSPADRIEGENPEAFERLSDSGFNVIRANGEGGSE